MRNKALFERAGQFIIDDFTTIPVDDVEQLHEPLTHPDIGDVNSPDVILDGQSLSREADRDGYTWHEGACSGSALDRSPLI